MAATEKKQAGWSPRAFAGEAVTLAVGAVGGLLFTVLHVPGGAMSGTVVAVAALAACGRAAQLSAPLRVMALSTMGVAIGSVVGPDTFSNIAAYPASIALMSVCVVAMTLASAAAWNLILRWPPAMALLSSVPGSMSYIVSVSLSMGLGSDAARIAVVQMSRVIFLVTALPFIVVWQSGGHYGAAVPLVVDPPPVILATLAAGVAAGALLTWSGMAGGMLLGALIASGAIHYLGWAPGRVPPWLLTGGQILLGSWVGSRFADFDWKLFWRICMGTTLAVGSAMLVSVGFAKLASVLFGVSFGTALIAYAPGGQDAMMVLALALGVDPIFVSAHHLARYFIINVSLPFLIARMQKGGGVISENEGGMG
jgi:membrane AbrB-like protein